MHDCFEDSNWASVSLKRLILLSRMFILQVLAPPMVSYRPPIPRPLPDHFDIQKYPVDLRKSCRHQFLEQLRPTLDTSHFACVSTMVEDGLYLHKRHIRGDHGKMLEQAGTALLHTVVYLKAGMKVGQSLTPF